MIFYLLIYLFIVFLQTIENDDQYIASIRNSSVEPAVMQHPNGSQPNQSDIGIYPNLDEFKFERVESERTRQRFHIGDLLLTLFFALVNHELQLMDNLSPLCL